MWNGDNGFTFCGTVLRNYIPALVGTERFPVFRDYIQQMATFSEVHTFKNTS
jgi:hypothetical protein